PRRALEVSCVGPGGGAGAVAAGGGGFVGVPGRAPDGEETPAFLAGGGRAPSRFLPALPDFTADGRQTKPEALLPLGPGVPEGLRVLVWFDGGSEGTPRPIRIPRP